MLRRATPVAALLALLGTATQAQTGSAAKVLLDQANYWYAQNRPEDAEHALDRLLQREPQNPDALGLLAEVQAQRGDRNKARATLTHLHAVRPNDPAIAHVEQAIRVGSLDPTG